MLFAEVSPDYVTNWLGMVGSLGFAVWFGYYTTAVLLPRINKDNNELTLKIVSDFRDEMRLERESHNQQMIAQRDECRREAGQLMAAFQLQIKHTGMLAAGDSAILSKGGITP